MPCKPKASNASKPTRTMHLLSSRWCSASADGAPSLGRIRGAHLGRSQDRFQRRCHCVGAWPRASRDHAVSAPDGVAPIEQRAWIHLDFEANTPHPHGKAVVASNVTLPCLQTLCARITPTIALLSETRAFALHDRCCSYLHLRDLLSEPANMVEVYGCASRHESLQRCLSFHDGNLVSACFASH